MKEKTNYSKKQKRSNDHTSSEDAAAKKQKLDEERRQLPMWSARERLIDAVKASPVLIIIGETGSGKTTQIPQFLLDAGFAAPPGSVIACTQPRRVAAITVAQRVAMERGCTLGQEVGYTVRFDDCTSPSTKIKYLTDGMLLREALIDPLLKRYSTVILDEAHERTVATDVLLGLLKQARQARKGDFRLVIMSATLDQSGFQRYFPGAKAAYVQGRQFPVEMMYCASPQESYLDASITAALQIHCDQGPKGDILVFLTGQEEIEAAERLLKDRAEALSKNDASIVGSSSGGVGSSGSDRNARPPALSIVPMYAALPPELQMKAFQPAQPDTRKIILSTNIAETSITIPGVKYVVDCGFVKVRTYNAGLGADCLEVAPISKAQARQRSGRAGREGPGMAFRLYTENAFSMLPAISEPEIRRSNLASVVLQLKAMGIADPISFDFMDPPPKKALLRAMELLFALGGLDRKGDLTALGKKLARLPVDPMFGRSLVISGDLGCTQEMLAIVAMVSCDAVVFVLPREKREDASECHRRFADRNGDHLTLLSVFSSWKSLPKKEQKRWCSDNFLNPRALQKAGDIYEQLKGHVEALQIPLKSCIGDVSDGNSDGNGVLRRGIVAGLFTHAARKQENGTYRVIASGQEVHIHPSSVLHGKNVECIVFSELVRTTRQYARGVTVIEPGWLPEMAPAYFARKQANEPT